MDVGELRIYKFIYTYKLRFTWLSYKYHTKKEFPTPYTPKPFNALPNTLCPFYDTDNRAVPTGQKEDQAHLYHLPKCDPRQVEHANRWVKNTRCGLQKKCVFRFAYTIQQ